MVWLIVEDGQFLVAVALMQIAIAALQRNASLLAVGSNMFPPEIVGVGRVSVYYKKHSPEQLLQDGLGIPDSTHPVLAD